MEEIHTLIICTFILIWYICISISHASLFLLLIWCTMCDHVGWANKYPQLNHTWTYVPKNTFSYSVILQNYILTLMRRTFERRGSWSCLQLVGCATTNLSSRNHGAECRLPFPPREHPMILVSSGTFSITKFWFEIGGQTTKATFVLGAK